MVLKCTCSFKTTTVYQTIFSILMQLLKCILSEAWQHSCVSLKLDSRKVPGVISGLLPHVSHIQGIFKAWARRERTFCGSAPQMGGREIWLPRKHLVISENMFGHHNLEELCWHLENKRPGMLRASSNSKNHPAQNISTAVIEKLCS